MWYTPGLRQLIDVAGVDLVQWRILGLAGIVP
jgi:hypothetical protein